MTGRILLGFEVASGEPVYVPLHHLAIFGMTQLSGKTTTLEALISRSGLKAIAFISKRGEAGFTAYNLISPYYKPRADWQFVEGLVNVALGEKVKYEPGMRWAIIKVSKGAKNLRQVKAKAEEMLAKAKRDFQKQLFEKLITYLEIVVPELERWSFSDRLELSEGVNVMDLSGMRLETQHLVIASTIEYAFQDLDHVVVIIPEAWETIPETKMTPVKWVAQQFIRKGAAIGNYMWIDSQNIAGVSKVPLRQCDNWLMGRMKEAHEVERILKQLLGMRVKAEDIQTLPLGHFYAAIGNEVKKVYVLPVGVPENVGIEVARGIRTPESVRDKFLKPIMEVNEEMVWKERYEQLKAEVPKMVEEARQQAYREAMQKLDEVKRQWNIEELQKTIVTLKDELNQLRKSHENLREWKDKLLEQIGALETENARLSEQLESSEKIREVFSELVRGELERLEWEPKSTMFSEMHVVREQPALTVKVERKTVELSDKTTEGKIAVIYAEGKLPNDKWFTTTDVVNAFVSHGWFRDPRIGPTLDKMCQWGFFEKHYAGKRPEYRVKLLPSDARSKGLLKEVEA